MPSSSSPLAQRGDGFCHPLQGTHSSSSKRTSKTSCAPSSLDTILVTLAQGYSEPAELGRKTHPSLSSLESITHTRLPSCESGRAEVSSFHTSSLYREQKLQLPPLPLLLISTPDNHLPTELDGPRCLTMQQREPDHPPVQHTSAFVPQLLLADC